MKINLKVLALIFALLWVGTPKLSAQSGKSPVRSNSGSAASFKFSVAPNPSHGQLTVFYYLPAGLANGMIEVIQHGRVTVARIPVSGQGVMPLNLANMPKGMYYVRLITAKGSQGSKIMLQ